MLPGSVQLETIERERSVVSAKLSESRKEQQSAISSMIATLAIVIAFFGLTRAISNLNVVDLLYLYVVIVLFGLLSGILFAMTRHATIRIRKLKDVELKYEELINRIFHQKEVDSRKKFLTAWDEYFQISDR